MTCKELCELLKSLEGTESWEQPVFISAVNSCGAELGTLGLIANHPDFPSRGQSPYEMALTDIPWAAHVKFNKDWNTAPEPEEV